MPPLKLHYSRSKKNWGDQLSPVICQMLSGREVVYAKPSKCDLVAIGSILSRVKEGLFTRPIHVWGTGFIEPVPRHKTRHIIHALRGKKSAELFINVDIKTFGDPGLLCDKLLPNYKDIPKVFELGIIPHYKDRQLRDLHDFVKNNPGTAVIDVFSDTVPFLEKLSSSRIILSSSLHGLIAADSLKIPNAWLKLSDNIVGEDFKFHDYYSIFNIPIPSPLTLKEFSALKRAQIVETYSRPNLAAIKQSLLDAFPFKK
ncbi:MAG: polysaccharide pyruvyl transferase family protein [Aliifodinibius sp.]|nr:polysaccharide pyruvyl transferase family protein [Fodinibius sp.]